MLRSTYVLLDPVCKGTSYSLSVEEERKAKESGKRQRSEFRMS